MPVYIHCTLLVHVYNVVLMAACMEFLTVSITIPQHDISLFVKTQQAAWINKINSATYDHFHYHRV